MPGGVRTVPVTVIATNEGEAVKVTASQQESSAAPDAKISVDGVIRYSVPTTEAAQSNPEAYDLGLHASLANVGNAAITNGPENILILGASQVYHGTPHKVDRFRWKRSGLAKARRLMAGASTSLKITKLRTPMLQIGRTEYRERQCMERVNCSAQR
jgi:hypothetical protein